VAPAGIAASLLKASNISKQENERLVTVKVTVAYLVTVFNRDDESVDEFNCDSDSIADRLDWETIKHGKSIRFNIRVIDWK